MKIRLFHPDDAPALARLMHAAIHALGTRDYTHAQLAAWSPQPIDLQTFTARMNDGRTVWVAEDATCAPCAFIELLPDGHIDRLYCAPDHAGTGTATALYQHLEKTAHQRALPRLTVEASAMARRFFLRQGFSDLGRQTVTRAGVELYNSRMEKPLSPAPPDRP